MDKQTAIDLLDNLLGMVEDNHDSDYDTAIKMGIDALQSNAPNALSALDCVDRQAAVDAIRAKDDYSNVAVAIGLGKAMTAVCELPSVQPEQSSEIQDILEYLDTVLHPIISPDYWNVYSELHDMISMLPSAQPEIIRCKDCKYCDSYIAEITSDGNMERIEYRCKDFHASVMPDEYCSRGERRDG